MTLASAAPRWNRDVTPTFRSRAAHNGSSFEAPFAHLLKVDADGKTVRGEFYGDSAKAAKLIA